MPITPDSFCDVAEEIYNRRKLTDGEPIERTVAGRAYYAAYLATREAVRAAYGNPTFDVDHKVLAHTLKKSVDSDIADVGTRLDSLRAQRARADYRLNETLSRSDAGLCLVNSRAVLAKLPAIISKMPRGIPQKN